MISFFVAVLRDSDITLGLMSIKPTHRIPHDDSHTPSLSVNYGCCRLIDSEGSDGSHVYRLFNEGGALIYATEGPKGREWIQDVIESHPINHCFTMVFPRDETMSGVFTIHHTCGLLNL